MIVECVKLDEGSNSALPVVKVRRFNSERDAWVYDQYVNHREKSLKMIMSEAEATMGWKIDSKQHLLSCVDAHCKDYSIGKTRRNNSIGKRK